MSLNAATLRLLAEKGLSATDIADVAEAMEVRRDPTAAERMRRHRAKKNGVTVTRNVTGEPSPNDIYSNPLDNPGDANASPPPFADQVVSAWNSGPAISGARKAIKLDAARKAQLRARVKDHGEDGVLSAIANLGASKFHCGDNDRGWRANLGWLLEAKNCLKALEMAEAAPVAAEPAPRQAFEALCDREIERFRSQGNEREALAWERKKRGEDPHRESTGPPRSIGALTAQIAQQAGIH